VHEFLRRVSNAVGLFRWAKALVKEVTHTVRSYRLLRDVDMLVVAGGGQLDEEWGGAWGHPFALMKWSVLTRAAGGAVVFLSVGACQLGSPVTRFFLRIALSLASYRSYRDGESRRLALEIARHAEGAVVPDLAFSLGDFAGRRCPSPGRRPMIVGVSPIAWRQSGLWPTENPLQHRRYLTELALFVGSLVERGIEVRLFSSSPPDDQIFENVYRLLDGRLSSSARELLSSAPVTTLAELLELLQSVEIVVTSRLHGALLSFVLRRPVLAISYDRKVATLMEQLEQSSSCVDIESVDSAVLAQKFASLETTQEQVKSTIDERCNQYADLLQHQYKEISTMLECHSRPARQQGRAFLGENH
jgi:polysaccharide pyruvyl transferase WcaK-like protein